jgi:hypothetical protein
MPRLAAVVLLLWFCGCSSWPTAMRPSNAWLHSLRPTWPGAVGDGATVDLAIVREDLEPPGYLAGPLWQEADEQIIPLEQRILLTEQGLRVGLIPQSSSAALQKLLTDSQRCTARRLSTRGGEENTWSLTKRPEPFDILLASGTQQLSQAELSFKIRLRTMDDGRTRLRLEPAIQHGVASHQPRPKEDHSGWELDRKPPEIRLTDLALEFDLGPQDFLIIGGRDDQPGTFGYLAFVDRAAGQQRVLVIRSVQRPVLTTPLTLSGPVPLALQTLWPVSPASTLRAARP